VCSPRGYGPDPAVLAAARPVAEASGGAVVLAEDPWDAVAGAHAVVTDVWVSMGQEDETATRLRDLAPFQVGEAMLDAAGPDAVLLHCLPAHRGQEVDASVLDGPRSAVWREAENRLPTAQAVIHHLVDAGGTT
jgi:ornithine carbamoyltransferase